MIKDKFKKDISRNSSNSFSPNRGKETRPGRRFGKSPRRESRVKPEFDQKIISIRRVARVVAGGRRFSFSVAMVAGNRKGSVGVGVGKATDTPLAIEKAFRDAKKNMIEIKLDKNSSIPCQVQGKICASRVFIIPTARKGVLAGSSVRDVVELAGIKNISAKIISRSKNRLNNAKAAIKALSQITAEKNADINTPLKNAEKSAKNPKSVRSALLDGSD